MEGYVPDHRRGNKYIGSHTTYIDLAADVADIAVNLLDVKGISPGIIQNSRKSSGGIRRVKFSDSKGFLVLTVRHGKSVQELQVYCTSDLQKMRIALARALRNADIPIAFKH